MKKISRLVNKQERPIKVMQYGEGNFLRGFILNIIDLANEKGDFNGNVAVIKSIPFGNIDAFKEQESLYTLVLRGKKNGKNVDESRIISCIEKTIDAYEDYEAYSVLATLDSLEVVISNTTEAGIIFDEQDKFELNPPLTYPGKLTKFLFERFIYFKGEPTKGLIILPVELIEDNGIKLKECILRYIDLWHMGAAFKEWIIEHNVFCNTLVDRIVTGYPKEIADRLCTDLGYEDKLLDVGEPFGLWVIESEQAIQDRFQVDKTGIEVIFTTNLKPYRERKVRLLNGTHTGMALAAYLAGQDIVRDCMQDEVIRAYVEKLLEEIMSTVTLPLEEVLAFKAAMIERFENPFINHSVLDISLNSTSKWKTRILPTFKDALEQKGCIPKYLSFSFAALMAFYSSNRLEGEKLIGYRGEACYSIRDELSVLAFFAETYSRKNIKEFVSQVASNKKIWGEDLTKYEGFVECVTLHLKDIYKQGMKETLEKLIEEE